MQDEGHLHNPLKTLEDLIQSSKLLFRFPPESGAVNRYTQLMLLLKQQLLELEENKPSSTIENRENLISKIRTLQEQIKTQNSQLHHILERLHAIKFTLDSIQIKEKIN
jgi:predicted ATPase